MSNSPHRMTWMVIASSLMMIVLGALAIMLPGIAGLSVAFALVWLLILSGVAHIAYALAAWGMSTFLWRTLVGFVYLAGGLYLGFHPTTGLVVLTWILAGVLCIEGVFEVGISTLAIEFPGSSWLLFDGIMSVCISVLIWRNWPSSASWAIGAMLGTNLILGGISRLLYTVAIRKASVIML